MGEMLKPWPQRLVILAMGSRYVFGVILGLIKDMFTKGPWNVLGARDRSATPAVLNDPALGTHGYLQLKDFRLHYVANGPEDAPLMLFLHGFPEFWFSWRHQLKHFAKKYRCVAVDMRGYNESGKPKAMTDYHISKLMGDIEETIQALGYTKCILVAHDMGGVIAWPFTNAHPELVDRLVVINAAYGHAFMEHIAASKQQSSKSWYAFFFQLPYLPELWVRKNDYQYISDMLNMDNEKIFSEDDIEVYKHAFAKPGALTGLINYYRCFFQCHSLKYTTKEIRVPTLIIWATGDKALDTELAALSAKYVLNCKLHYIQDASHFVTVQYPDEVNASMDKFLKEEQIPAGVSEL